MVNSYPSFPGPNMRANGVGGNASGSAGFMNPFFAMMAMFFQQLMSLVAGPSTGAALPGNPGFGGGQPSNGGNPGLSSFLGGGSPGGSSSPVSGGQSSAPTGAPSQTATSRGTGYYPDSSALEGGYVDRRGKKLNTLQDFLAGRADYVSVAMDKNMKIPYGKKLRIPELEKKYGRPIEFRVVDTGGAFTGKGTSRIDICTASKKDSLDPTVNGPLTLQFT